MSTGRKVLYQIHQKMSQPDLTQATQLELLELQMRPRILRARGMSLTLRSNTPNSQRDLRITEYGSSSLRQPTINKNVVQTHILNFQYQQQMQTNMQERVPNPEADPSPWGRTLDLKNIAVVNLQPVLNVPIELAMKLCPICYVDKETKYYLNVFECGHQFCPPCTNEYVEGRIKNFTLVECPELACGKVIDDKGQYFLSLPNYLKQKYQLYNFRRQVLKDKAHILCPDGQCKRGYIITKPDMKVGHCELCLKQFCITCRLKPHNGHCQGFEQSLLKNKYKYKKCGGCNSVVERISGCPHMTCRCGHQFCYFCARAWGSNHKCMKYLAGGDTVDQKLYQALRCLRPADLEDEDTAIATLSRIPTYMVMFPILLVYTVSSIVLFAALLSIIIVASALVGVFVIECRIFRDCHCCVILLSVVFLPVTFLLGWAGTLIEMSAETMPKFIEISFSGGFLPCL